MLNEFVLLRIFIYHYHFFNVELVLRILKIIFEIIIQIMKIKTKTM